MMLFLEVEESEETTSSFSYAETNAGQDRSRLTTIQWHDNTSADDATEEKRR